MPFITQPLGPAGRWGLDVVDGAGKNRVGVFGGSSLVGTCLLPLLTEAGWQVVPFSRQVPMPANASPQSAAQGSEAVTPHWICVAPIWVVPSYYAMLEAQGARRIVMLSSTSRFTKGNSTDSQEQATARQLADAEASVQAWAQSRGVDWVILRPTLIYGLGRDKNIAEIARFIHRFGFFPLFGKAKGLRQPIHAIDVADACLAALQAPGAANRAYDISGGETLPYQDMVRRVFIAMGCRPHMPRVPLWVFRLAVNALRRLPRYRQWSSAMAERMNRDLVFDHSEAARDLGFKPRRFTLTAEDLPP